MCGPSRTRAAASLTSQLINFLLVPYDADLSYRYTHGGGAAPAWQEATQHYTDSRTGRAAVSHVPLHSAPCLHPTHTDQATSDLCSVLL